MIQGMVAGETDETGDRTLSGHTFHYPRLIPSAFTASNMYVGSSIEFYHQADLTTSYTLPDNTTKEFKFDRDLGFVRLNYGVDFRPWSWMTFGLDADYLAEVGTNEETLFLYGGQTGFDFRPNVKFRIVRGESTGSQLGIRLHGTFQAGLRAVPQGLLVELSKQLSTIATDPKRQQCLIEADFECTFTEGADLGAAIKLTRKRNGGGGSINYAQALGRYLGGQLSLGLEGQSTVVSAPFVGDIKATGLLFHVGAAPSLNLYPKLPVGMVFEYRFELDKSTFEQNDAAGITEQTSVSALGHRLGWGLYYTGRRDLLLGWIAGINLLEDATRSLSQAKDDPDAFIFAAQFDMRYFF